jgi:hypothetical protein
MTRTFGIRVLRAGFAAGFALSSVSASAAPPTPGTADPSSASAATPAPPSAGETTDAAATRPRAGARKRISLDDDFLIEGELEKPSAFYVFRRANLGYDWARLDARFSPLVLESVQDPLF